jgi:cytidine deaminase
MFMKIELTTKEAKLVEHAKKAIVKYNKSRQAKGGIDTLYAFLITENGDIYEGAAFEPKIAHATVCGERHAMANMAMSEGNNTRIDSIIVADPVPSVQEHGRFPCGTDRNLIWQFGKPDTSVLLMQYIRKDDGWTFPKIEKFSIAELYPHQYEPPEDLWEQA